MATDVDNTIPLEYMHPEAVDLVVTFIRQLKVFPSVRRQLLVHWAYIVGVDLDPELVKYVQVVDRR